ncbi:hypothetical protein DdX_03203 [Ditylenchus destructor]|uniref:Uncharacterized protein n=1 Tax=Ditylenchus destructor TaxID=166010 RepID=A0AAD4RCS5_9BILA|nr:hypothetical protein DdX_03203 [Ditylenchus destructor]
MYGYYRRLFNIIHRKFSRRRVRASKVKKSNGKRQSYAVNDPRKISVYSIKLIGVRNLTNTEGMESPLAALLNSCTCLDDVEFVRILIQQNPAFLKKLGVPQEESHILIEELYFFVDKSMQLKVAEERVKNKKKIQSAKL